MRTAQNATKTPERKNKKIKENSIMNQIHESSKTNVQNSTKDSLSTKAEEEEPDNAASKTRHSKRTDIP